MKLSQILADIICNTLLDPDALDRSRNRKGALLKNALNVCLTSPAAGSLSTSMPGLWVYGEGRS